MVEPMLTQFFNNIFVPNHPYCVICLRTEAERRLEQPKYLKKFITSMNQSYMFARPNQLACHICERQAATAFQFRLATNLASQTQIALSQIQSSSSLLSKFLSKFSSINLQNDSEAEFLGGGAVDMMVDCEMKLRRQRSRSQLLQTEVLQVSTPVFPSVTPALNVGEQADGDLGTYIDNCPGRGDSSDLYIIPDQMPPLQRCRVDDMLIDIEPNIKLKPIVIFDDDDPISITKTSDTQPLLINTIAVPCNKESNLPVYYINSKPAQTDHNTAMKPKISPQITSVAIHRENTTKTYLRRDEVKNPGHDTTITNSIQNTTRSNLGNTTSISYTTLPIAGSNPRHDTAITNTRSSLGHTTSISYTTLPIAGSNPRHDTAITNTIQNTARSNLGHKTSISYTTLPTAGSNPRHDTAITNTIQNTTISNLGQDATELNRTKNTADAANSKTADACGIPQDAIATVKNSEATDFILHPIVFNSGMMIVPSLGAQIVNGYMIVAHQTKSVVPQIALQNGGNLDLVSDPKKVSNVLKMMSHQDAPKVHIFTNGSEPTTSTPATQTERVSTIIPSRNSLSGVTQPDSMLNSKRASAKNTSLVPSRVGYPEGQGPKLVEAHSLADKVAATRNPSLKSGDINWEDKIPMDIISFMDADENTCKRSRLSATPPLPALGIAGVTSLRDAPDDVIDLC